MIYNLTKYNTGWDTRKLRSLGDFARGKSKHRPRNDASLYKGGGYPFIQTGDIKAANLYINSHEQEYNDLGLAQSKLWDTGTLAITIAANIAETGILAYPMCFPDSVVGFTAYPAETSEIYMHYIFAYIRAAIQKSVGGSIQDNLNIDYLENLDFKIPDIQTQNRIVSVLVSLDRKISLNNDIIIELEKVAKLLYDYWFVQFDFPNSEGKPYHSSGGKMLWNEQLKRKIPKGWGIYSINDMTTSCRGVSYNIDDILLNDEDGVLVLRGNNIQDSRLIYDNNTVFIPDSFVSKEQRIRKHDIILTMSSGSKNHIGKCAMFQYNSPHTFGAFLSKFTPQEDKRFFVFQSMISDYFSMRIKTICNGTGINNLINEHFSEILFAVPNSIILKKFEKCVSVLYEQIGQKEKENQELASLRDFLLPLLMNGQVTVKSEESASSKT